MPLRSIPADKIPFNQFPLFASILHDSPFAQLCASLQVLRFVTPLRVMRLSAQSFRSSSLRGGNTFSKYKPNEGANDNAESKTNDPNSRHTEVVSITRGSGQQARHNHEGLQRI